MRIFKITCLVTVFFGILSLVRFCSVGKMNPSVRLEEQIYKNLELNIYYLSFSTLTGRPINEKDLINSYHTYKITVKADALHKYIQLLNEIDNVKLKKPEKLSLIDLRLFCQFTSDEGNIYSFGLQGPSGYMLVNGEIYNYDRVFYDFVINFLPCDEVKDL